MGSWEPYQPGIHRKSGSVRCEWWRSTCTSIQRNPARSTCDLHQPEPASPVAPSAVPTGEFVGLASIRMCTHRKLDAAPTSPTAQARGTSVHGCERRHVPGHDRTRTDETVLAQRHAADNGRI